MGQLSFADVELGGSRKKSRVPAKSDKVDRDRILELVKAVDRTGRGAVPPTVTCRARSRCSFYGTSTI